MHQFFGKKRIYKLASKNSKIKAGVAERAIQTLKNRLTMIYYQVLFLNNFYRLYKYFSEKNTTDWVTPLTKFLHAINNSVCRSTGVKPSSVNKKNWPKLWKRLYGHLYGEINHYKTPKLNKGDTVRITLPKEIFSKGYFPTRSDRIYTVRKAIAGMPEYYKLRYNEGDIVKGRFYKPELVKTILDENTTYRVEKVIRSRKKNGRKQFLVKFIGDTDMYWIDENDLIE
jgi:hypothetical protein